MTEALLPAGVTVRPAEQEEYETIIVWPQRGQNSCRLVVRRNQHCFYVIGSSARSCYGILLLTRISRPCN